MKFAKVVFTVAGIWGILVVTPLFFIFDRIGQVDPPPITHPGFYYGFTTVTLAWQVAFLIIGRNPVRYRPIMVAAMFEKFWWVIAAAVLFAQQRMHASDMPLVVADCILGVLFVAAFAKTKGLPATS